MIGGPTEPLLAPDHRRLFLCVMIAALVLTVGIVTVDVSLRFDFSRLIPAVLEVTLRDEPEPRPPEPPETVAAETALPTTSVESRTADPPAAAAPPTRRTGPSTTRQPVDWYEALQRAAADVVDRYATTDSLHPEFDELRRIARQRYAEPQTGKPPLVWENVEKDIYGRTLLRRGNCFQVLDDANVGNRYAFETFERHLVFCGISFGKRRPKNLPWVETIRAKYPHLRDPDGSQSSPLE